MTIIKNNDDSFNIDNIELNELNYIFNAVNNADLPTKRNLYDLIKLIKSQIK